MLKIYLLSINYFKTIALLGYTHYKIDEV